MLYIVVILGCKTYFKAIPIKCMFTKNKNISTTYEITYCEHRKYIGLRCVSNAILGYICLDRCKGCAKTIPKITPVYPVVLVIQIPKAIIFRPKLVNSDFLTFHHSFFLSFSFREFLKFPPKIELFSQMVNCGDKRQVELVEQVELAFLLAFFISWTQLMITEVWSVY